MSDADLAELQRLRTAMEKINRLRSNIIITQSCSWSNATYPLVAILGEAGYELEGATDEQQKEHLACYGGAGKTPHLVDHTPPPEHLVGTVGKELVGGHVMQGSIRIHAERWRQQEEEGFAEDHDDEHRQAELARAAVCYAIRAINQAGWDTDGHGIMWPWGQSWWKPSDDPAGNLVKAGALIAAEIDRLQRQFREETGG